MAKLTIEELDKLREKAVDKLRLRESGENRGRVIVHLGTCGIAAGGRQVLTALLDEVEKQGIKDITVTTAGCAGLCSREPMATIELFGQTPVKYADLTAEKIKKILAEHVVKGKLIKEYALAVGSERVG
ncbi:MAG: (2Fe-2S) ferredoxin domain-containing protein [Bacteroidota bacterium]|nr:(2Fe-2S) ferredoxin domain-containing protein [Bacteroidota bacterium]